MTVVIEDWRTVWTFRVVLTVLFVYFVNRSISTADFAQVIGRLESATMALSLVLFLAGLLCQVRRWEIILRYEKFVVAPVEALKTILTGNLFAFITPGRLGELLRGIPIAGDRKADAVFAVIVDKLFIVATTLLTGLGLALVQTRFLGVRLPFPAAVPTVVAVGICALAFVAVTFSGRTERGRPWQGYVGRLVRMTPRAFTRAGAMALLCSFGAHAFLVGQTAVLMTMFGVDDPWVAVASAGQAYALMAVVPLFVGNIGIREYSFALFLGQFSSAVSAPGTVSAAAFGTSIVILAMNLVIPALAGLVWIIASRRT